ncbi:MAG: type II secretion system protein [Pseudomonadota bacterium]
MRNQKGFTLIELIIVIVVLGILAVTAAPQFIDFSSDARTSSVKGLKGALQGASQTTYGLAAIEGELTPTVGTLSNDVTVVSGYPTADVDGIIKAAGLSAWDGTTATGYDGEDWVYTEDGDSIYIAPAANVDTGSDVTLATGDNCQVEYEEAQNKNNPPEIVVEPTC